MHETEISVASISIQVRKEEALSLSRKHNRELEDLQAGVKYCKVHHTKKAKTEDEQETILPAEELEQKKEEKNDFYTHSLFTFISHTSSLNLSSKDC